MRAHHLPLQLAFIGLVVASGLTAQAVPAAAQQGWSGAPTAVFSSDLLSRHELGVGADGSAFALVGTHPGVLHVVRRDAVTREWADPVMLAPGGASDERVLVAPSGDAVVIWVAFTGTYTCVLRAAHYEAQSGEWSVATDLVAMYRYSGVVEAALDVSGNVVAAWAQPVAQDEYVIQASRYSVLDRAWSAPVSLSSVIWAQPVVVAAMDTAGNATVAWSQRGLLTSSAHAARYASDVGQWEGPVQVSERGELAWPSDVAADAAGNVMLLWNSSDRDWTRNAIRSARFIAATRTWSRPREVSAPALVADGPRIAVEADGDATAVWMVHPPGQDIAYVMGARFSALADAWSPPVDVERRGDLAGDLHIVADRDGNVTIVWNRDTLDDDLPFIHAMRYSPTTGLASPIAVLSEVEARYPRVGVDGAGNVLVTWYRRRTVAGRRVEGREWVASPATPAIASVRVGTGMLALGLTPPVTPEPPFAPTTYEYSIDDGVTWTARAPASTVSPLWIHGLSNDVTYVLRVRAVNGAGPGAASAPVTATPTAAPDPPMDLRVAAQADNTVTLAWTPPPAGLPLTAYVLEGGVQPGEVLASIPAGGPMPVPSFTFNAPTGAYYIRMHAVADAAWSLPSNEIRIFVNVPVPPDAPTNLLGLANGTALALSWINPSAGTAPISLWLTVTGAITTRLPLPMGEAFTYANVPPGTYTFSVSASGPGGVSAPSNSVTLTFPSPCGGVPGAPTGLQAWTMGRTIFLAWQPPVGGTAVTDYTVWVSGAYVGTFATTGRTLSGSAGPGRYVLSVTTNNACGTSSPTPEQVVVIP